MKPSGPGLLFYGRFLITASISMLVIGLFIISISSWFSLRRLSFVKNLSISSSVPFYCHIIVHNRLIILCISALSLVTSPFSLLILLICFFSFFLDESGQSFVNFVYLLKEAAFRLIIFAIISFISFSFISARIFMISFLLLILGFFFLLLFLFLQLF